ncbi:MAG: aminomethyl-transferring glycine dehydrogenase subunit GcvPA [Candidatus Dadabacteria bacterium]|nr:MAG: aminomethyl-transferring glycine dehydrogenase subunit GcvPA [Candidatus Dadabacteria bacterium]
MRFIPYSERDVARALETIGAPSVGALFESIPAALRERASLDLPPGRGEREVVAEVAGLAAANRLCASFQGAGCYYHYVPAAVRHVLARPEFATAYTPYQPEVSQGTLQAAFEFQTYVTLLMGLDVANASLYDGASALAEAVLMALRLGNGRRRILVSRAVHPEYRAVVETYLRGSDRGKVEYVPAGGDGRTDLEALEKMCREDVAAVCVGYPNFYGVIDDLAGAAEIAHARGALAISVTQEALALALLQAPGRLGADVAVAEGQSFGLPPSYGGPGVGLFATKRQYVRQMPGRVVGETLDDTGRRGYVLTLATREQHIRRERATSNICTNQGLAALAVTVYLGLHGRFGLRRLAEYNASRAHWVAERLEREAGCARVFSGPFFNEFVVRAPSGHGWFKKAVAAGVVPGVLLGLLEKDRPELENALLVTVTECAEDEHVERLVELMAEGFRS